MRWRNNLLCLEEEKNAMVFEAEEEEEEEEEEQELPDLKSRFAFYGLEEAVTLRLWLVAAASTRALSFKYSCWLVCVCENKDVSLQHA
ncbi:hypothetical protein GW17_00001043 [Ensete ventricosum]|nr:hypothetical protein GW17_00001043 [Ensete ventricosum]